jgi:hypothetical protein
MSSVPAANPGATNSGASSVLQFLSSAASPLVSSLTSSASVQSALENASPADLIQLSAQALKFQEAEGLFSPSTTATPSADLGSFTPSQLASYQSQTELAQEETLLGTEGASINVLA